jgi:hypothetical protein
VKARGRGAERAADMDRRAAMFWMLHEAGASYGAIGLGAGLSPGRVRQVCQDYAYQLHRRSEYVTGREPFMGRLRRAGALLGAAEREGGTILKLRFESCSPWDHAGPTALCIHVHSDTADEDTLAIGELRDVCNDFPKTHCHAYFVISRCWYTKRSR